MGKCNNIETTVPKLTIKPCTITTFDLIYQIDY